MVRLRVKQTVSELVTLFDEMFRREAPGAAPPTGGGVLEGADDEIDRLFGD
jgi:hypothetical protein